MASEFPLGVKVREFTESSEPLSIPTCLLKQHNPQAPDMPIVVPIDSDYHTLHAVDAFAVCHHWQLTFAVGSFGSAGIPSFGVARPQHVS